MIRAFLLGTLTTLSLPWLLLIAWMRSLFPSIQRNVLIIQAAKIGDLVCMTPLFRALHEHGDRVTVLCLKRTADVLIDNPCVAAVIPIDDPEYRGWRGSLRLWYTLFFGQFSVSLVPFPGSSLSMVGLWSASPLRIYTRGRMMSRMERWFRSCYTEHLHYQRHTRTFTHYMALARLIGAAPVLYRHEWYVSQEEEAFAAHWIKQQSFAPDQKFAAIALRAGNALKEWPIERFVAVARHIISHYSLSVLFIDTNQTITAKAIALLADPSHSAQAFDLSLRHLAAIIKHASLFVSVDTGPLYIAHALGVPVVDIIGPVDSIEQPPIPDERVALVLPPPPCAPSSFVADTLRTSTPEQQAALESTTVEMVTEAIDGILG
ncbi:MAG: glycosyltransferase family 9 protein [Candidatus Peregrinibacteria bacterium]